MRDEFDLDPKLLYLNSGSHSIAPLCVLEAVTRYQRAYERNPTQGIVDSAERIWGVHAKLGEFFGMDPRDFFLRANVSLPLNNFILDLPLEPGRREILLSDLEYGAVANIARFRAEREGLELRHVELPMGPRAFEGLTRAKLTERIVSQITPSTGMLVLSHVATFTGLVLPIEEIARETRRLGVPLIIDGAHAPGSLPLDFSGPLGQVDFYAGNLHKWMMGPKGTAFARVSREWQERLPPPTAGWTTYEWAEPYKGFSDGSMFALKFFMTGCHDYAPFFALSDMHAFWKRIGFDRIQARRRELQKFTEECVAKELDWEMLSPPAGEFRGPLLAYALPAKLAARDPFELSMTLLREHGLQLLVSKVKGRPYLRFSPHVYNEESEIERGIAILRDLS